MKKREQNPAGTRDGIGKDEQMTTHDVGVRQQWNRPAMTRRCAEKTEGKNYTTPFEFGTYYGPS